MAVGDFQPWTVYYKAVADFSDLIKEAAKARAEMAALTKSMDSMGKGLHADVRQNVSQVDALTRAIQNEGTALEGTARAARSYNKQVLYGGRDTIDRHLADLNRQKDLTVLLQRARQRGFMSPQQDYAFRQREYQQLLLWNRASQQGYQTPEQYLGFLQKERQRFEGVTQAWRERDLALRSATTAATEYARKVGGTTVGLGGLDSSAAGVNALSDALAGLPDTTSTKVTLDDSAAMSGLAKYSTVLDAIPQDVSTAADFSDTGALGDLAAYTKAIQAIPDVIRTRVDLGRLPQLGAISPVDVRVNPVIGKLNAPHLSAINENINFGASGSKQSSAAMLAMVAAMNQAKRASADLAGAEQNTTRQSDALAAAATRAAGSSGGSGGGGLAGLAAAADSGGGSARRAYGAWGLLGKQLDLFAGAHTIGLWHVLLDLAIEFAAVAIPAAVTAAAGLAAFGAAALKTYAQVYSQLRGIYIVSTATGKALSPMTDKFAKLQKAVQPDVLQQYGDALTIINHQGGLFAQLATSTGGVLDRFSARVTYAMTHSTGGLARFIKVGQADLTQFGSIVTSVGHLFMSFVKASEITHVAEDILTVFAAIFKVTAAIASAVGPVGLAVGIGAHAAYVYGGLLVTGLQKAGIGFARLGGLVGKLSGSFMGLEGQSYSAARALGASDAALASMAAKSTGIQAISKATGVASGDLGTFYRQSEKAGTSLEDTARASAKGQAAMFRYGQGLNKAGTDAVAISGYLGNTAKETEKVAATMEKAGGKFSLLGKAGSALMSVPVWAWVAAGAAVLGVLTYKFITARSAADNFVTSLEANIRSTAIYNLIPVLSKSMLELATRSDTARTSFRGFGGATQFLGTHLRPVSNGLNDANKAFNAVVTKIPGANRVLGLLTGNFDGISHASSNSALAAAKAAEALHTYIGGLVQMGRQTVTVANHTQQLGSLFGGNLARGLGAATAAGITNSQMMSTNARTWAEAMIQVSSMIKGYALFGQKAGALGNDLDAVTYAASNQLKQMKTLNDAWDTFTANVAGPKDTFIKFAGDILTFNKDAKLAGASMHGLGSNALQLQGDFQGTYADANKLLDALRTSGGSSRTFTKVAKEIVASLIPMAGRSKAARAEISVLAQEAGGPATTSLKVLTGWAGKIKDPLKGMAKATDQVVTATSNLSVQAKRVSATIESDYNAALAAAELKTLGLGRATSQLARDQAKYGDGSKQVAKDIARIRDILQTATKRAQEGTKATEQATTADAKNSTALKDQADWFKKNGQNVTVTTDDLKSYTKHVMDNTTQTDNGKAARKQLIQDYINAGLDSKDATKRVNDYTAQIQLNKDRTSGAHNVRQQLVQDFKDAHDWSKKTQDMLNNYTQRIRDNTDRTKQGRNERSQLIKDLEKTGINARTARGLVDKLSTSIHSIPKTRSLVIGVTGGGKYKITQTTAGPNPIFKSVPVHPAAGGYITETGKLMTRQQGYVDMTRGQMNVDSVPAIVMPGEYVIRQSAVQKYGRQNIEKINNMQLAEGGYIPATSVAHFSHGGPSGGGGQGGSGYANPVRRISGLSPERVDMGVDFGGTGPVYAIGPGIIRNVRNSGWPAGTFISEQLTSGSRAGEIAYEAETINPQVRVGQRVNANTVTSYMHGPASIEIGWAAPPGTGAALGASQFNGSNVTAYGDNMARFLHSLGAPMGIESTRISGRVPKNFPRGGGGAPAIPLKRLIGELSGNFHESGHVGSGPTSYAFPDLGRFHERANDMSAGMAEYNMEASMFNAIAKRINASNAAMGGSSGPASPGLMTVARYLMAHGYNKAAAAGMAGLVGGEAGPSGSPESVGSGGAGLIGWTPPSAMISYGGTSHAAGIGHNSTNVDMGNQLSAMVRWASAFGFPPSVADRYHDPMNAAYAASAAYERPAVRGSDVHSSIIMGVYRQLAEGGLVQGFYNGGDVVKAAQRATHDKHVQQAMLLGSYLDSRWNPGLSRPRQGTYGAWQLPVTGGSSASRWNKADALNPYDAARKIAPAYTQGVRKYGFGAQPHDAESAFLFAQKMHAGGFSSSAVHAGWAQTMAALSGHLPAGGKKGPPLVKWETRIADGKHHLAAMRAEFGALPGSAGASVGWTQLLAHNAWAKKYEGRNIPKGFRVSLPFSGSHSVPPPNSGKPLPNQDGGQKWQAAEAALLSAYTAEKTKMGTFDSASTAHWWTKVKGRARKDLLARARADEKLIQSRQSTLSKDMAQVLAGKANGRRISEHQWDLVGTDINRLQGAMGHVPLLYGQEHDRAKAAWASLSKLKGASARGHSTWNSLWGPDGSLMPRHYPGTPGPEGRIPGHKVLNVPPLGSLLPSSPVVAPVYAAGGLVMSGAAPSMPSSSFGSMVMPAAMAGGGQVAPARQLSPAGAAASGGGGDRIGIQGDVHIHNPKQERTSESIARTVQRTAFLAGRGVA